MKLIASDRKHGQKYRKRQHVKILLNMSIERKISFTLQENAKSHNTLWIK